MAERTSRRLVIDSSVVRAAGGEGAVHPTSKRCRDFLKALLKICHRVVLSDDIKREWDSAGASRFSQKWLTQMTGRGKVVKLRNTRNDELRQDIRESAKTERERREMLKDAHLIEAALATDKTVASLDENARSSFRHISTAVPELKPVVWVNPANEDEEPIEWLKNGARPERQRKPGFGE